ncbi:MAG TPA: hypothetical protein VFQ39_03790, partial [Longimicrobium sp.]|nr:hypothetical protein [Longimicrobium sp.]
AYVVSSLFAAPDGVGVYAIQCTGSCNTTTPTGNTFVDRYECPNTSLACWKQKFISTPAAVQQIHVATSQAMLLSDRAGIATTGGNAFFANAVATQQPGSVNAVAAGTLVGITLRGASTGANWATMNNGAIVAVVSSAGTTQPVIYHPNLPGNHIAPLPVTSFASNGNFDLVVYPTGEVFYSYSDDVNNHVLGAAFYDGSASLPRTLTPVNYGGSGTGPAKNFFLAAPGVFLGEVGAPGTANYQAYWINLFAGSATPPASAVVAPVSATAGVVHDNGVFGRNGITSFAVSDDGKRAIFVTDDPPAPNTTAVIWRLHLVNLADGSQVPLAGSERMLCAFTNAGPTADCTVNGAGAAHYPRFVHSAPPFVGGAPTGTTQVVVWEEETRYPESPPNNARHARIWLANYSGATPAVAAVDRLNVYSVSVFTGPLSPPLTEIESPAAGALFFLSDNDVGGANLYSAPLAPPAASLVTSTMVMDQVYNFRLREETTPARLIVSRADGTLYSAALAAGSLPALVPVAETGLQGDAQFG